MSTLKIYNDDHPTANETLTEVDAIASRLHPIGVRFERWQANHPLDAEATNEQVLAAYQESIDRLMSEHGFQAADVMALRPDHPDKAALRQKFLDEHTHADFEVRFFVDGKGLFFIHTDDKVYGLMCEQGDLISVPANTRHWFDMGAEPSFKCIRLFTSADGWVAEYTGDDIAKRFPHFETF